MARHIDQATQPAHCLEKRVVVLSMGRNGTMGLYHALQILGFKPYHMKTLIQTGVTHMQYLSEGIRANHFGDGSRFGRDDFEKWMGEYDCIIDIPGLFAAEMIEAYPNAKFILTTRDPAAWVRSVRGTILTTTKTMSRFPLWHILQIFAYTRNLIVRVLLRDRGTNDDKGLAEFYRGHNSGVMKLIPQEKLLVVRLEDGLGWEQICPFLGAEIPDIPYPRGNDPKQFHKFVNGTMMAAAASSVAKAMAFLVLIVGLGIWCYLNIHHS